MVQSSSPRARSVGSIAGRSGRLSISDVRPAVGRHLERLHHLEHVVGQFARGAMRTARADRMRQVGHADDAVVAVRIGVFDRPLGPASCCAAISIAPPNRFGSGTSSVASVP